MGISNERISKRDIHWYDNDCGPLASFLHSQEILMGKGDKRRPYSTTREEQNLRDKYAHGDMTFKQYERAYRKLMRQGLIQRNGRILT